VSAESIGKRHFRALRARQTRSLPLPAPLATRRPKPAKTLQSEAIWSIRRVGIGESKRKSRFKADSLALSTINKKDGVMSGTTDDTIKGRAKEAVGVVTNNQQLKRPRDGWTRPPAK
jgi:hypothetical protein